MTHLLPLLPLFYFLFFCCFTRSCFNCHPWQINCPPPFSCDPLRSLNTAPFFCILSCFILSPPFSLQLSFIVPRLFSLRLFFTRLSFFLSLSPSFFRCGPCGTGEALHPEAATVLCSFRLPVRPFEWPEMEGSEAGGSERNGGVHYPQQECHHRAHLPGGGSHGQ